MYLYIYMIWCILAFLVHSSEIYIDKHSSLDVVFLLIQVGNKLLFKDMYGVLIWKI